MALIEKAENNVLYLSIVGGNMVQKVKEGTPGAEKREYETSDGQKGVKWEIRYRNLTGYISGIDLRQSDFGEQCALKITDGKDTAVLNMALESRYFADFAQRLSNINMDEQIKINPYSFDNNGKERRGMSISQGGEKVQNFFWDAEKKKAVNGLPRPENNGEGFDSDDWKMYFIKLKKFLKAHVEKVMEGITITIPESEDLSDHMPPEVEEQDDSNDDLPF